MKHCRRPLDCERKPRLSFLELPREVRDLIYHDALSSDQEICVFRRIYEPYPISTSKVEPDAAFHSLQPIAFNLIQCNRQVRHEAAPIFYANNTFRFTGEHDWSTEIAWLRAIGPDNYPYIRKLELTLRPPSWAHVSKDGSCYLAGDDFVDQGPFERNPLLQLPLHGWGRTEDGGWEEGAIDYVDPAYEELFRLLGCNVSGSAIGVSPKLSIRIGFSHVGIPGVTEILEHQDNHWHWVSMDTVNIFENWRAKHASRNIDVFWWFHVRLDIIDDEHRYWRDAEAAGWEVEEDKIGSEAQDCPPYFFRRRPITGAVYADGPNPFGQVGPLSDHGFTDPVTSELLHPPKNEEA